jgi:hypothetical protein
METYLINSVLLLVNSVFAVVFSVLAIIFKEGNEKDKSLFVFFAIAFGTQITALCLEIMGIPAPIMLLGIFIPCFWWIFKAFFPSVTTTRF